MRQSAWISLQPFLDSLGKGDSRTALLSLTKNGRQECSYRELARRVAAFAQRLRRAGVRPGDSVLLFAENRPEWIAGALAVIRAGAVAVPVDIQFNDDDLAHVLSDSNARIVMTTQRRRQRIESLVEARRAMLILLDQETNWEPPSGPEVGEWPALNAKDPAVLFYTSGTTGPPKGVPLSHANVGSQLEAIAALNVVTESDRVLLPLPLHHVYPFVIGMLAPLSLGLPLILPFSLTGQQLLRALQEGGVTAIVGVPRLYSALYVGIQRKVESSGRLARRLFKVLLNLSAWLRTSFGLRVGKFLFPSLHKRFGQNLRLLASGGSALDPDLAAKLESLGWQVAIGYGLTETSPLLSSNLPNEWRSRSVGRALPGVEIRIDLSALEAEEHGERRAMGEILARGPNVFCGYRNLPEQTAQAFTADGWFRTGDIGYSKDGFLYISGRSSTLIKTESGEKVQTEDVEAAYAKEPAIREIGVLSKGGRLAALIVPERAACGEDLEAAVRSAIESVSRRLPSYERLSDYAITHDALPHTRLGKIQRHRLVERFEAAKRTAGEAAAEGVMSLEEMSGEDRALFEEPAPHAVWQLIVRRYPGKRLTPDTSLQFDLSVDSLEWLNLTLEIAQTSGAEVTEEAIARIDTVRDLLREVFEAGEGEGVDPLAQPESILDDRQRRWLKPLGPLMNLTARSIYAFGRGLLGLLFRVRVEGTENLPTDRPWILTPNHVSYLDGFVLANALRWPQLRETYWAGWTEIATANFFMRFLSRLGRILPVEPARAARTSLALGAITLKNGNNLVWFPEGGLSRSGQLQTFKPGIGMLLERFHIVVVPVCICGTRDALPPGHAFPRFCPVRIIIGQAQSADDLMRKGDGEKPHERIAAALQAEVAALGERC